jgi:hypothetical protein
MLSMSDLQAIGAVAAVEKSLRRVGFSSLVLVVQFCYGRLEPVLATRGRFDVVPEQAPRALPSRSTLQRHGSSARSVPTNARATPTLNDRSQPFRRGGGGGGSASALTLLQHCSALYCSTVLDVHP